jgi:hypothetical protein
VATLADILATAVRPEKTVPICFRGDLVARIEDLERELEQVQNAADADDRLASPERAKARQIAETLEQARADMQAASIVFRLRGLSKPEWDALTLKHPPRDDDQVDRALGFNRVTLLPVLVRKCLVDQVPADDAEWARLVDVMSSGQFDKLADGAYGVSATDVVIPFSLRASALTHASSEPPE